MKRIFMALWMAILSMLTMSVVAENVSLNLNCVEQKKKTCDNQSCKDTQPSINIQIHIEKEKSSYKRCGTNGCDEYDALVSNSGTFIYISNSFLSSIIKINTKDLFYLETATLGLEAFIGFGKCDIQH